MLWTVAFYLIENCSSEIQDPTFASSVLEVCDVSIRSDVVNSVTHSKRKARWNVNVKFSSFTLLLPKMT